MKTIQKVSALICLIFLLVFIAIGLAVKWPNVMEWFLTNQHQTSGSGNQVDPFNFDPLLPSHIKELHPSYKIRAELETTKAKINGSMQIDFDNPHTEQLFLYIYDYKCCEMNLKSVRYNEQVIPFERNGRVVTLENPAKDERISLDIEFISTVPRTPTRYGVVGDIWTLSNWYPILGALDQAGNWYTPMNPIGYGDPFVYHYADYDVRFVSPEGYQWITSWGRGTPSTLDNERQEIHYEAKRILNFTMVGSPLYKVERMKVGSLTVDIGTTNEKKIPQLKEIAESAISTYSEMYGPLPYPYVAIAETGKNTVYAMEYANMAIFSRDMYVANQIDHWLPHEIAHMWWYNSVSNVEPIHGWIDEGMVEASVYYYTRERYGEEAGQAILDKYWRNVEELKQRYPHGKMSKQLHQFAHYKEFSLTWYSRSALLFDGLREQIGEEKYRQFLRRVQQDFHGKMIGPEHFDQALSRTLRGDASYFVPNVERRNREPFLPASVDYYINIVLNNMAYFPSEPARQRGEAIYLPLREVMEQLGYKVEWSDGMIHLRAGAKEITLREQTDEVTLNGEQHQLPEKLTEVAHKAFAPLSFFEQVMEYQVSYDPDTRTVRITVPNK